MSVLTRIAILGGGFAGTAAALRLEQRFKRRDDVEITLLDTENFFTFTPLLPEVPSGSIQPKHIVFPLRALLKRTQVRQAEVQAVDLERQQVVARHCGKCGRYTLPYDHLVLALGGVSNFFGTPGFAENALTIKCLADATALHAHVIDKLEHADLQTDSIVRREMLTFVIAGGGFAGVETIAELNDFVRGAGRYYPNVRLDEIRVVLIQSGPRILPEVSESLSAYALQQLRRSGVEVLLQTMAVNDRTNIWAVGDSAAIPDLVTGKTCPPTAQYALRQGYVLADNIAASIDGRPLHEFRHKSLGLLAGLGRRSAVAEVFGLKFSGFFAWWLWRTIYLLKLPGLERKVRVALDWTLDLFFPRDIVYLRPLHTVQGGENVEVFQATEPEVCQVELPPPVIHSTVG